MRLIKPSVAILPYTGNIYKDIEIAGRNCYKSENNITEDSSTKFVQMLIDRGHTAMLEHGTVYLKYSLALNLSTSLSFLYILASIGYFSNSSIFKSSLKTSVTFQICIILYNN